MQIYSLNTRYNVDPETYSGTAVDQLISFSAVLPTDGNPGPLAYFVLQVDATEAVTEVRVNGLLPTIISDSLLVNGKESFVFAVDFAAPTYEVTVTLDTAGTGTATLVGYAYGNVESIVAPTSIVDTYITGDDVLDLTGPGALLSNSGIVLLSAFFMGPWAESTGNAAAASAIVGVASGSEFLSFAYPMPRGESWPEDASTLDGNISRVGAAIVTEEVETLGTTTWTFNNAPAPVSYDAGVVNLLAYALPDSDETSFNCDCDDHTSNETLSEIRTRLLIRLGYAAQAANPPQGMAALLDDFIRSGQKYLYNKFPPLRTERFYTWTMQAGVRFYDLAANEDTCTKRLDEYKISWVGVSDLNEVWLPMGKGIPPEFYTVVNYNGIPSRYEIRQCIEVFPPPASGYKLRIKAHFGLEPLIADTDQTTVDSELVFMWALANAKNHYGQSDAKDVAAQANTYLGTLVAGAHATARYVPGTCPAPAVPMPVFLPLI